MAEEKIIFRISAPGAEEAARAIQLIGRASGQVEGAERRLTGQHGRLARSSGQVARSSQRVTIEYERQSRAARRLGSQTNLLTGAYRAFGAVAIGGLLTLGVSSLLETEQRIRSITGGLNVANTALVGIGNASTATARDFAFLRQETERLGIDVAASGQSFAQMAVANSIAGLTAKDTRELFLGVAEAGTALKLSGSQVSLALQAISQTASKGRVSMEEIRRQLSNHIPGATQIAARALGVSTQEFEKMVAAGIDAKDLLPAFAAELRRTFGSTATENANTSIANVNRLKNALFFLRVEVSEELNPAIGQLALSIRDLAGDPAFLSSMRGIAQSVALAVDAISTMLGWINEIRAGVAIWQQTMVQLISVLLRFAATMTGIVEGVLVGFLELGQRVVQTVLGIAQGFLAFKATTSGFMSPAFESLSRFLAVLEDKLLGQAGSDAEVITDYGERIRRAFSDGADFAKLYAESLGDVAAEQLALDGTTRATSQGVDGLGSSFDAAGTRAGQLAALVNRAAAGLKGAKEATNEWDAALADLDFLEFSEFLDEDLRQAIDLRRDALSDFWDDFFGDVDQRQEVLRSIASLEEQVELAVRDTLGVAQELNLTEDQRALLVQKTVQEIIAGNSALEQQSQFVQDLAGNFQRLATDQLSGLFSSLLPEADGIFEQILVSFGEMLADMAAAALAAKITENLFGGKLSLGGVSLGGAELGGVFGLDDANSLISAVSSSSESAKAAASAAKSVVKGAESAAEAALSAADTAGAAAEAASAALNAGASAAGSAGAGAAGAGAAGAGAAGGAGTAATAGASSAALLALVPLAIFAVGSYLSDRRRGRIFGFGAGASVSGGQLSFSTAAPGTQSEALTNRLGELLDSVLGQLEGSVETLGRITVLARRDGKAFKSFVDGELIGEFKDAEKALSRAVVAAFSGAVVDDPDVQTALRASASSTAEQLAKNVETALRLRDRGLSDAAQELRRTLSEEIQAVFDFVEHDIEAAGFAIARGQGFIADQLQDAVNDFLGIAAPDDTAQRRDILNQAIQDARAQIEAEIRLRLDLLERLGESSSAITTGVTTFTGTLSQASGAVGQSLLAGGQTIGVAAGVSLDQVRDQLEFWRNELALLPDLVPETAIPQSTGGGGGRRQRREALRDQLEDIISGANRAFTSGASAVSGILGQVTAITDEAQDLGTGLGLLGQAIQVLKGDVEETIQGFIDSSLALIGQTSTPAPGAPRLGQGVRYAQLTQDLAALTQQMDEWRLVIDQAREELGDLSITQGQVDAAVAAQFQAFGQQAIDSLGLPLERIRSEVGQITGTIEFLRQNQELLGISAERFAEIVRQVGEVEYAGILGGLLGIIGENEEFEDQRRELQRIFFQAEIEQYRLRFELLAAEGVLTKEQMARIQEAFDFIDSNFDNLFEGQFGGGSANDNLPPVFGGGSLGGLPGGISNPYDDAEAFLAQLAQLEGNASGSPFDAIAARFASMRDEATSLGAAFNRFGSSLAEVLDRIEDLEAAEIAAIFDQALDPLRAIQDDLSFGGFSSLNPRGQFDEQFARAQALLQQALPSNTNNEERLAAIEQLQTLIPGLLALAPDVLNPTSLLSFQDFLGQALAQITGYNPAAGGAGGGIFGTGTGGGGGGTTRPPGGIVPGTGGNFDPGTGSNVVIAGGRFARTDAENLRREMEGVRSEVAGLRADLSGLPQAVDGAREEAAARGRSANQYRRRLAASAERSANANERASLSPERRARR